MSQLSPKNNGLPSAEPQILTPDVLTISELARIYVFDRITHDLTIHEIVNCPQLDSVLTYYGLPVMSESEVANYYNCLVDGVKAVSRQRRQELIGDGMLCLRGNALWDAVNHLKQQNPCFEFYGSELLLLPPRALLKMALFLPGRKAQLILDFLWNDFILPEEGLDRSTPADWQATFARQKLRKCKRIGNAAMIANQEVVKKQNLLPYIQHFGQQTAVNTWARLLTYSGSFPPPRGDLWVTRVDTGSQLKKMK
jgi:hypothetical protein